MAAENSKITCAEEDDEESMTPTRRSLFRSSSWSVRSTTTTTPPSSLLNPNKNPDNHRKNNPSIPRPNRPSLTPLKPLLRPLSSWSHLPSTPSSSSSSSLLNYRDCSRILDHVYLGSESVARDLDSLRRHGITHVLNCVASTVPSFFPHHLTYHTLSLHDSPSEDITSVLYDAFDFIEHVRLRPPSRVLVHCSKGASRSAALVIAYLMWSSSQSFEDSLAHVRSARAVTDPNLGFASQLLQCQSRVHALPPSPGSAVRVYRMAPHSPYDPIHLVPKAVEKPWAGRLDSRGAFLVVNVGSGIWVWVGRFCEEVMAVKASAAAEQVVRYEKAQGEIVVVREGTESYEFWDILSNGDGEDCGEFGKRRVELYDLDYEIFNRAIKLKGRESNTTTMIEEEEEENEVEGEEDERERFFSLSSASGDSSTTNSGDTSSTFSPASSSSDWHNCSPSGLEFSGGLLPEVPVKGLDVLSKMPPLRSRKGKEEVKSVLAALPSSSCSSFSMSIAERRGSNPPSLFLLPPVDGGECKLSPREIVQDWCLSPPFVLDGEEQPTSSDRDDDDKDGEEEYEDCRKIEGNNLLGHPILFRWPSLEKLEDINPAALDSGSVFMLLAPDLSSGRRKCKRNNILYVWIGREIKLISSGCGNNSNVKEEFARNKEIDVDRLRGDFIHRMALPLDIPVQILREKEEEEELEQFLNHLFPFHQASTAAISE